MSMPSNRSRRRPPEAQEGAQGVLMAEPRLSLDLVPSTAWWANVRSNVSKAEWEKCKAYSKLKTERVCIICGQSSRRQGRRYDTEAHEIWNYSIRDGRPVQTLVDIVPLCSRCHQCKHMGRSRNTMDAATFARLFAHFCTVNGWEPEEAERYIEAEYALWERRSQIPAWDLDLSLLAEIGVEVKETA